MPPPCRRWGTGGELSPRTVRLCHTVVSQALEQARRWGLVARNVAADATVPRVAQGRDHPALGRHAPAPPRHRSRHRCRLRAVPPGAGRDGLPALRGAGTPVDRLDSRPASFGSVALAIVGGKVIEKDTKSHQARRIAIDPATLASLETHRQRSRTVRWRSGVVLARTPSSSPRRLPAGPWRPDVVTNRFIRLCRKAGVRTCACTTCATSSPRTLAPRGRPSRRSAPGSATATWRPR